MQYNDKEQFVWDITFAQVLSIRFHPANDHEVSAQSIKIAADIADLAIIERKLRCPHG